MPASSKLLPLKHADEVRVGLCVASGCSALRGKTVFVQESGSLSDASVSL